jgi:hypothetical protein
MYHNGMVTDDANEVVVAFSSPPSRGFERESREESVAKFCDNKTGVEFYFTYYRFDQKVTDRPTHYIRRVIRLVKPIIFAAYVAARMVDGKIPEFFDLYRDEINKKAGLNLEGIPAYLLFRSTNFIKFIDLESNSQWINPLRNHFDKIMKNIYDAVTEGVLEGGRLATSTYSVEVGEIEEFQDLSQIRAEVDAGLETILANLEVK